MAAAQKGFVLYFDVCKELDTLEPEQRGWVLTVLYRFAMECAKREDADVQELLDRTPQLTPESRMACRFICETILRDTRKWRERRDHYIRAAQRRQDAKSAAQADGGGAEQYGKPVQKDQT